MKKSLAISAALCAIVGLGFLNVPLAQADTSMSVIYLAPIGTDPLVVNLADIVPAGSTFDDAVASVSGPVTMTPDGQMTVAACLGDTCYNDGKATPYGSADVTGPDGAAIHITWIFNFVGTKDDQATTHEGIPVSVDLLADDSPGLTVVTVTATDPTQGTWALSSDGTVLFTPANGFTGTATATYTVNPSITVGGGQVVEGTVSPSKITVQVLHIPTLNNDAVTTAYGTAVSRNVFGNDLYLPDGTQLTAFAQEDTADGTWVLHADGTIDFTPVTGFSGNAAATVTVAYPAAAGLVQSTGTETLTVTVGLPADNPPASPSASPSDNPTDSPSASPSDNPTSDTSTNPSSDPSTSSSTPTTGSPKHAVGTGGTVVSATSPAIPAALIAISLAGLVVTIVVRRRHTSS